ncbi:MAG: LysR family transcriptional regulator [Herpetosiphonaceae bacterium]|nr:LysR family transcriptional regulator [Herpetosiphonaceae bacterium]
MQSSVTTQIQALEADLGVPLFDRLGKRVQLTDAGVRLLRYADQVLTLMDEARQAVTGGDEPTGSLTISAPETLCTYRLPQVLHRFRARYPQVRLIFQPNPCMEIRRRVTEGLLDIAFLLDELVQSSSLVVTPLVVEPLVVVAAPDHPLAQADAVHASDLADASFFFTELGCSYRTMFEQALSASGYYPATTFEFWSVEAIKHCVMVGLGVSVLPAMSVATELAQGRLIALPWRDRQLEVVTQVVWHKDKWMSPALRAFLEVTYEVLNPTCTLPTMLEEHAEHASVAHSGEPIELYNALRSPKTATCKR